MKTLEKYGIFIKNKNLLNEALTHSSYANEHNTKSYERLEYLGDAVLEIVTSEYIYHNTNYPEGKMSKLRSLYVCENALYEYSKAIKLSSYIKLGNGIKKANKAIVADVFESIIAVIYLEYGLDKVKELFNELIVPHIKSKEDFLMDYKTLLQEDVQTVKQSVIYNLVSESGPSHNKLYTIEAVINGLVYGKGTASSKKAAEQLAAKEAYEKRA